MSVVDVSVTSFVGEKKIIKLATKKLSPIRLWLQLIV